MKAEFVEVALNVPVNQTFTYSAIPAGKISAHEEKPQGELFQKKRARKVESFECAVGSRVQVMFGNRRTTGVITALHEKLPQDFPVPQSKIRPILRVLDETPLLNEETMSLGKWISSFYLCSIGEAYSAMIPGGIKESDAAWGFSAQIEEDDFKSAKVLSDEQKAAVQGILDSAETEDYCEEISGENKIEEEKHSAAKGEIFREKNSGQKNLFQYIYGATGSGKTEVFLSAAEKILERGKGVIYLVPEIALTPQVARAVLNRFGSTVAVLHSRLTPAQKLFEYRRIIKKEARVVIGARSAIFAPVPDLGMIIIDEEHDSSYKSESTPRYHARQVAMHRAQSKKIPLVMGSATPSVEAWNSIVQKKFECHYLTKRLSGGKMPLIECVDLSREKIDGSISKILEEEIRATLAENRQVILFLNRRGFNHIFRCQTCGFELKCKNCSVPMTYHKAQNKILCHYCGHSLKPLSVCPKCASLDIGYLGFGTEFIENEVKSKFPSARAIRLDTDSLGKKDELEEKIAAFKNGDADILLGTQMIAKGLNFPKLKLVGVILADTSLHIPDFRAAERTFSLITQVAGRAGRFFPDGKVIVQTYSPENPAIYFACHSQAQKFYADEIELRKVLSFPPFSRLLRLVFRSTVERDAEQCASEAKKILGAELQSLKERHTSGAAETEILGPSECALSKVAANYRHQILLRGNSIAVLQRLASVLIYSFRAPQGVYIEADVDPASLL